MNQNVPSEYPACNDKGKDKEFDRVPWKQPQLQLYFQDSSLSAEFMYNSYIYGAELLTYSTTFFYSYLYSIKAVCLYKIAARFCYMAILDANKGCLQCCPDLFS